MDFPRAATSVDLRDRIGKAIMHQADAQGFLWNARWDGGSIIRWAPDGTIDKIVKLPCRG